MPSAPGQNPLLCAKAVDYPPGFLWTGAISAAASPVIGVFISPAERSTIVLNSGGVEIQAIDHAEAVAEAEVRGRFL
jgi:hypothetical protein